MIRYQDWQSKLSRIIEASRHKTFQRGLHDCALFAGSCIETMTGEDFTSEFVSNYSTREQAYDLLASLGYDNLEAVANAKLGAPYETVKFAQRGDCVLVEYEGHDALAIVDLSGKQAVTTGANGLVFYKREFWAKAWKV